jgi:transcription elongation factor Elf1
MRITITCEDCGRRHRLERSVDQPGPIWIVCHDCELPLRAVLEETAETVRHFRDVWAEVLDMTTSPSSPAAS